MSSTTAQRSLIDQLIDAVNRGDTEAFLALFAPDGVVEDWGRKFEGTSAIRTWSDKEFIGAHGRLRATQVTTSLDQVTVEGDWHSDFHSGASRFVFTLDGGLIRSMTIPSR